MVARNMFENLATEAKQQALQDLFDSMKSPSGAMVTSGTRERFRDGFTTGSPAAPVDPAVWTLVNEATDTGDGLGHLVLPGGDSQGSAYLRVSLSPFQAGKAVYLVSKEDYGIPIRHAWGASMSQRVMGQEFIFGLAESDDTNAPQGVRRATPFADLTLPATATVASNVATYTFATPHGLKGNDRVVLFGNTRKELNVGPAYLTVVDAFSFTVASTIANGTYPAAGTLRMMDPSADLNNCAVQVWGDNTTVTNMTPVTRREGTKSRYAPNQAAASSAPTQPNTNPYSDAFWATGPNEIWANVDEVTWRSWSDGLGGITGITKYQQSIPDETLRYKLFARIRNHENFSRPIARITSIAKSASTVATVTTDVPHGLVVNDSVGIQGVRDQTNFASTTAGLVASIVSPTVFTVGFGISATVTDLNGGVVWLNNGGVAVPGAITNGTIQSVAGNATNGILTVTTNAAPAGVSIGDTVHVYGLNGAARAYEGAYRVMRLFGSTLELRPINGQTITTFGAITTGGMVIRRTDARLHFARILGHTRSLVEVVGGRGNVADANNTVPVTVVTSATTQTNSYSRPVVGVGAPFSTTVLGVGLAYTSGIQDAGATATDQHSRVKLMVSHTAGSVHGYATLEQSTDNSTWRETHRIPVPSDGLYHTFELPIHTRYWRVKFTNGSVAQTAFYFGAVWLRGEASEDNKKNLSFPLTPLAGQAAAANAVTTFPVIDLGPNHSWNLARFFVQSDQASAAAGIYIQQSVDGTGGWAAVTQAVANTAGNAAALEDKIICRYIRAVATNGATAATALRAVLALVST